MATPIYKGLDKNAMPVFAPQKYIYAVCDIQWQDGTCSENYIIKLSTDYIEDEDDKIFFYCEDYESFLSLCKEEFREDFRVLTIHDLCETI